MKGTTMRATIRLTALVAVPWAKVVCSATASLLDLALVEPLTVGFHAADRGRVAAGETLLQPVSLGPVRAAWRADAGMGAVPSVPVACRPASR